MWWSLVLLACGSPPVEEVDVVVAARDLNVGVPIAEGDVVVVRMPKQVAPVGGFSVPTEVLGRVAHERILANEPIHPRRLADAELQRRLEALVPRDLEVTTVSLADGERPPQPGRDLVDVHAPDGSVIATKVPVHRVDRDRVAIMATEDQMRALQATRGDLTAVISATP